MITSTAGATETLRDPAAARPATAPRRARSPSSPPAREARRLRSVALAALYLGAAAAGLVAGYLS